MRLRSTAFYCLCSNPTVLRKRYKMRAQLLCNPNIRSIQWCHRRWIWVKRLVLKRFKSPCLKKTASPKRLIETIESHAWATVKFELEDLSRPFNVNINKTIY